METGANKGQPDLVLTALDGGQDLPPGAHPLWAVDDGLSVRWLRTSEDRSSLVEAGLHHWTAVGEAALNAERAAWLEEQVQRETGGQVTWMSEGAATVVPKPLREKVADADWLEAETGLRHLGTDAEAVVGSPYIVVHAPDHALRQAISKVAPRVVFRHPRAVLAEGFLREERGRDRTVLAVHLGVTHVDLVLVREGELLASVHHAITAPEDAVYRSVHLLHALELDSKTPLQLSGQVKPAGPVHRAFQRHFDKVDLHYGRFIPAIGPVTGLHRQQFLPLIQLIRCA